MHLRTHVIVLNSTLSMSFEYVTEKNREID